MEETEDRSSRSTAAGRWGGIIKRPALHNKMSSVIVEFITLNRIQAACTFLSRWFEVDRISHAALKTGRFVVFTHNIKSFPGFLRLYKPWYCPVSQKQMIQISTCHSSLCSFTEVKSVRAPSCGHCKTKQKIMFFFFLLVKLKFWWLMLSTWSQLHVNVWHEAGFFISFKPGLPGS